MTTIVVMVAATMFVVVVIALALWLTREGAHTIARMTDQALIMIRGGDSALRTFCSGALMAGLATHADFHEAWGMTAKDDDVESTNVGRVVFLRLPAANVATCMQQLKQELDDADATAVAIPVLAAF